MIDHRTNNEQFEELKSAAVMIGIALIGAIGLLIVGVFLITRWWIGA